MVRPPIGLSWKLARTVSGIIMTERNATPAVKTRLYMKMTSAAFLRLGSFACSIFR